MSLRMCLRIRGCCYCSRACLGLMSISIRTPSPDVHCASHRILIKTSFAAVEGSDLDECVYAVKVYVFLSSSGLTGSAKAPR